MNEDSLTHTWTFYKFATCKDMSPSVMAGHQQQLLRRGGFLIRFRRKT